jgi:hypothetical protein
MSDTLDISSSDQYAAIIRKLAGMDHETNWRGIVYEIAAMHPTAVLRAVGVDIVPHASINSDVWRELLNGKKIAAIKAYRTATGTPLKVAKEDVESIISRYLPDFASRVSR